MKGFWFTVSYFVRAEILFNFRKFLGKSVIKGSQKLQHSSRQHAISGKFKHELGRPEGAHERRRRSGEASTKAGIHAGGEGTRLHPVFVVLTRRDRCFEPP